MAKSRVSLQEILEELLGSRNVYFQPPESIKLKYPCIVYERTDIQIDKANNGNYRISKQYIATVIDKNPDSEIPDKMLELPFCSFSRHFVTDNLNHDVFIIYF